MIQMYSIKNEKLGFFNRPIYADSMAEACNYIQNVLMADADRALLGLKDDLALYYLGTWDAEAGLLAPALDAPILCCALRDIFDTIPEDKIPRSERQINDNLKYLDQLIKGLGEKIATCETSINTLRLGKKGVIEHD